MKLTVMSFYPIFHLKFFALEIYCDIALHFHNHCKDFMD